ncbi:flavoprotein [Streptomyces sp. NPDC048057]|uniref:flavoprotein n=1 Tax=Streptomyces sp. NPDC048057 TaxID=3155628 RepID=UPI0033CE1BA2
MSRKTAPEFGASRLLIVGTGAVNAMHLPFWTNWLRVNYPELQVRIVLTPSAERFITRESLTLLTQEAALSDRWPTETGPDGALHVRLVEWAETIAVFPACLNFISRLSLGLADTPALLALQCSEAPIGIAPSLPPGAEANPVFQANLRRLAERPNVTVAPTRPSRSVTTGRRDAAGAAPLWDLLTLIEERRQVLKDGATSSAEGRA